MSIELKKANEYEKAEQEKIPVEEKPAFHVAAPVGWINDPNGFSWYQGQIHLFYQYQLQFYYNLQILLNKYLLLQDYLNLI